MEDGYSNTIRQYILESLNNVNLTRDDVIELAVEMSSIKKKESTT